MFNKIYNLGAYFADLVKLQRKAGMVYCNFYSPVKYLNARPLRSYQPINDIISTSKSSSPLSRRNVNSILHPINISWVAVMCGAISARRGAAQAQVGRCSRAGAQAAARDALRPVGTDPPSNVTAVVVYTAFQILCCYGDFVL